MFSLLKIPVICIMCVYLVCGSGAIGFIDTTLSIYLEKQVSNRTINTSYNQTRWGLLMWEIGRRLGNYGDHPRPRVADRETPSRVDKRVASDREGATDKQCQGEGKLWSQYVITNREEGKEKPPRLFPKTGYPLGYPEPALQQKTEERREITRNLSRPIDMHTHADSSFDNWMTLTFDRLTSRNNCHALYVYQVWRR